jgi:succinate dehydrogenase hydrophobic anchor subunit
VSEGAVMMVVATAIALGALLFVVYATARSIQKQRTQGRGVWREFGLGLVLMILFFSTWLAQGIAEWQVFTDDAREHGEEPEVGDFVSDFGQSTMENWQSEFLQLFSFVTLAALFIHKGSAESKDSDEKLEASLRRIETHLGTLPPSAPDDAREAWQLPPTPLEATDRT